MKAKKVLKILGIIFAIILIFFIIHTARNFIIITDLQNKIAKYSDNDNHNIKIISKHNDGTIIKTDYYKKDNKKVVFLERELNGETTKLSIYDTGETNHTYTEGKDVKIVSFDSGFIEVQIYNGVEMDNIVQKIIASIIADIKKVNENGKEYYQLRHVYSPYAMSFEGETVLVAKDTGLIYKNINAYSISEREYEFNNVDDSIFLEPDISQYKIQEN